MGTCAFTSRIVCAKPGADISPRNRTLVPNDHGLDDVRKPVGKCHSTLDLLAAQIREAGEPQPLHDLHAMTARNLWDLIEPMVDRVGPDTVRYLLELGQILVDLARVDRDIGTEWILVSPKGRIGNTGKLIPSYRWLWRDIHRCAEPAPERNDHASNHRKKRGRICHT